MADEEKLGNVMFIFRTNRMLRDQVARVAAQRVLEGRVGLGPGATYSANQVFIEAICKELNLEYSPKPKFEDAREKVGVSLNFPKNVHQALAAKSKESGDSMNELITNIMEKYLLQNSR